MKNAKLKVMALGLVLSAACKDSVAPGKAGIVEVSPTTRSVPANSVIAPDIQVKVVDGSGKGISGASVQFSIGDGGGTLTGTATVTTDANGLATAPVWRLGKSANGIGGQILRVKSGTLDSLDIKATAASNYQIVVRFFDDNAMTAAQKLLFTAAAQRIQGIITGDQAPVGLSNQDISSCLKQTAGTTVLSETIDDLLIYATVKPNDGPGKVLASAGPCYVRTPDNTPIIGVMSFDDADFNSLAGPGGSLQEVITHEMLHVVGIGSLWSTRNGLCSVCREFIDNYDTTNPLYNAAQARAGCVAIGGTTSCATKVPVEGCATNPVCQPTASDSTNGAGTRNSHWRETTFGTELMTGFINNAPNPLSAMTIGALADLGYAVNSADTDAYVIAAGSIMASSVRAPASASPLATMTPGWEQGSLSPLYSIDHSGFVRLVRKGQ